MAVVWWGQVWSGVVGCIGDGSGLVARYIRSCDYEKMASRAAQIESCRPLRSHLAAWVVTV